jgi:hypothetical protein
MNLTKIEEKLLSYLQDSLTSSIYKKLLPIGAYGLMITQAQSLIQSGPTCRNTDYAKLNMALKAYILPQSHKA